MIVDSSHRFTVIKLNDSPVLRLVKYIHFLHNVHGKTVTSVYYDRYNISYVSNGSKSEGSKESEQLRISLKVAIQLPELNYFRMASEIDTKT